MLVAALNVGLWGYLNRPVHIADWHGDIGGVAFNPFQRYQDPIKQLYPSESELDGDIRLLSRYTKRLRTYSSVENPQIPRIAKFYGMTVMAGAWIEGRAERNERELSALIALSRKNDNINRAIVGNEVILRGDLSVKDLINYLDRARAQLKIPVSTAEPLDTWQRHPELAAHVDFITVHIL
ncbi:MAG: benzoate transporter, partial [Dokdonella sp.]